MSQNTIRHPVVTSGGKTTHVLVPIEEYLTVFARPDEAPEGYAFIPMEVSERVLEGMSPLKAWRRNKNLTQEQMAERMGVSRPAYAQMEKSGTPRIDTLRKAAAALDIEVGQLAELYGGE